MLICVAAPASARGALRAVHPGLLQAVRFCATGDWPPRGGSGAGQGVVLSN